MRSATTKTLIPKGVAAFLPEGVRLRRSVERNIFSVFFREGYEEVITPMFEYIDTFSKTSGEELLQRAYKFVERSTGRIMVLRPDVTPQIARMAATLLRTSERPLRLCYSANLFLHEEENAGYERETFQMGGELIGPETVEADAEVIILAIEMLKKVKIKSFKVVLGQIAFTRGILKPVSSRPDLYRKILGCLSMKDQSRLAVLLKETHISAAFKKQVLALPNLYGEGEEVQKRAASITDSTACQSALQRLSELHALLTRKGFEKYLFIDLSEVRRFDYYTGTTFEIFADSVGVALGGGGRCDHLLEKFGAPSPSIGFALHIERVQQAMAHR
jgi:ATP phosphoribosyltransferase regulatory subunit